MTAPTGVIHGMTDVDYHSRTELSSTGVRQILDSPARFKWAQSHRRESVAFDVGHAVHAKILGAGPRIIEIPDEHLTASGNVSAKAATVEWLAAQRAAGLVPIGAADLARCNAIVEAVLAHPAARGALEQDGSPEVSVFGTDPETGVACRARFDYLSSAGAVDIKTTSSTASSSGFGKDAAKYGYPIQEAHYDAVLAWATGEQLPPMTFVVVEKQPPHLVAVHRFDAITRITAADLAARGRRTYAECLATDTWPGYPADVITTQPPGWWFDQAEDDTDIEMEVA